jgi:hypothetical protein
MLNTSACLRPTDDAMCTELCADERPPEDAPIRLIAVTLQNWLGCSRHWGRNAGGGTDDDGAASFRGATLRAFLRGGGETGPDRGGDDLSCVMSFSTACNVTMFWDIWSCLAASSSTLLASCSTLFRITARSRATSSRTSSGEIATAAGAGAV